jgi:Predicted acetyltransferase
MDILLRNECESDYREVEFITREAFWNLYKPGCNEHLLAHKLRKVPSFIQELDFVAVVDGRVVGNIMYSRAKITNGEREHEVITFGPISVLPSLQSKGVGSALIRHTLRLAEEMGHRAVVIFGNPNYYHRFGFVNAESYGISTSDGLNFDAFMALELFEDALKGISGRFFEDEVFKIDEAELEEFDKQFPHKEKGTPSAPFN